VSGIVLDPHYGEFTAADDTKAPRQNNLSSAARLLPFALLLLPSHFILSSLTPHYSLLNHG
jgi:hypothetical protein